MKRIIEDPTAARSGDWFTGSLNGHPFEGELWESGAFLIVGNTSVLECGKVRAGVHVESVTREVPDLPTEPGTVFFATVRGMENVQVVVLDSSDEGIYGYSVRRADGAHWHASEHIDPESVRIVYTPGQEAGQ